MKNFLPDITQIPIRSPFLKRKKSCPLSGENSPKLIIKILSFLRSTYLKEEKLFQVELHQYQRRNKENWHKQSKEQDSWLFYLIKWINYGSHFT